MAPYHRRTGRHMDGTAIPEEEFRMALKLHYPKPPVTEMRYAVLPDRMPPLKEEQLTEEQKEAAADIAAGPRGEVKGPYWPILRSPGYMRVMEKVGEYFRFRVGLNKRLCEMTALIGARAWTQQFEWNAHYPVALRAGVKPEIADAIGEGRRPRGMAADEELLYDFVNELMTNKSVCDDTYARAKELFGERGIIDIIGCLGYYSTLAMVMNVARSTLSDGRPLPLTPVPAQLKSVMPNSLDSTNFTLTEAQKREFEGR